MAQILNMQHEPRSPRLSRMLFGAVAAVLLAAATNAAGQADDWQTMVREDVWLEHGCKVSFFSHIVERETKNGHIVLVKVHCEDQRSFDAVQEGSDSPFTFKECTPREKTSC